MAATIDAIVRASFYPMSIIIVGVGDADFLSMDQLDADKKRYNESLSQIRFLLLHTSSLQKEPFVHFVLLSFENMQHFCIAKILN